MSDDDLRAIFEGFVTVTARRTEVEEYFAAKTIERN
jgi:hypothetical protein